MSVQRAAVANNGASLATLGQPERKSVSLWRQSAHAFFETRLAGVGLFLVLVAILMAVLAPLIAPYDPNFGDFSSVLAKPSWQHWLGTDELGRDILSRLMYGSVVSLQVGFGATILTTLIGVSIGVAAGYAGGWVDEVVMRVTDGLLAFPSLILALAIAAVFEPSITSILLAVSIVSFSTMARLARASTLSIREQEFVEAARSSGASTPRLILVHILPNSLSPIIIQFALLASYGILAEASLSFLGVGVRPPQASWGGMLQSGYQYLEIAPWLSIVPGLTIFLTVLGFNLVGDGLRAAFNPRLRHGAG
ncbi:MAG TPA: ABC transporter permease [Thermomicrobiales bacterium]|nr:ABC transporter permease [Thermomicrobiales bacterium]